MSASTVIQTPGRHRRAHRRHGIMQVEILITVFLTAIVVGFATQIVMNILSTDRQLADAERSDAALDRAVQRLRRDTERAGSVSAGPNGLTLGAITWAAESKSLVRREGEKVDHFDALRDPPVLSAADGVVTLQTFGRTWAFRPLADAGGGE